ncbi:MAG: hypothetical protein V1926_03820 [Candidatus Peregrinibacteria bacterium]
MTISTITKRLTNTIFVVLGAILGFLFFPLLFVFIDWIQSGRIPNFEATDGILIGLYYLAPAPFFMILLIALLLLHATRNWKILENTRSSLVLGLILGICTALIEIPFHIFFGWLFGFNLMLPA